MTDAILFDNVMRHLWGDESDDFLVRAVAERVRSTPRINPENAFEVIDLLGPEHCSFMDTRLPETGETYISLTTIKFRDDSSILIEATRGIGSAVEVL